MRNPESEEENIIKDIINLFRLRKEESYTEIEDIRNIILRDLKNLF